MRMRTTIAAPAILALASLAGCGSAGPGTYGADDAEPSVHTRVTYEAFESIRSLSVSSDVVVTGTVGDVLTRADDTGGNTATGAGVPMVYYEFQIDRVLSNDKVDPVVVLGRLDADALGINEQTVVRAGQDLLLFLDRVAPTTESNNAVNAGVVYTTLSGDNGVLDISGDTATARSAVLTGLHDANVKDAAEPFTATISSIQRVVSEDQ